MKKKKSIRNINWEDYGISRKRYKELEAFCLQYEEKKSKIKYGLAPINFDGMPRGNAGGSTTENNALENVVFKGDCSIIEEAAQKSNPELYRYILKSVTLGLTYEVIEFDENLGRIPICRTDFYGYRRLFFYYLDRLKIGYKLNGITCYYDRVND